MNIKSASVLTLILSTTGCGNGGTGETKPDVVNASVCFNETLYTVGTEYTLKTKSTYKTEQNAYVSTYNYKVLDEKPFKGQPAIRIQNTTDMNTDTDYDYFFVDSSEKSVSWLGETYGSTEESSIPGRLFKFNLDSGSSYDETTTVTEKSPTQDVDTVIDIKYTFKGVETITVPAGTYETCKFELSYLSTNPDGSTDKENDIEWLAVKHGFSVKYMDGESTDTLVEATINGTKINGTKV